MVAYRRPLDTSPKVNEPSVGQVFNEEGKPLIDNYDAY